MRARGWAAPTRMSGFLAAGAGSSRDFAETVPGRSERSNQSSMAARMAGV